MTDRWPDGLPWRPAWVIDPNEPPLHVADAYGLIEQLGGTATPYQAGTGVRMEDGTALVAIGYLPTPQGALTIFSDGSATLYSMQPGGRGSEWPLAAGTAFPLVRRPPYLTRDQAPAPPAVPDAPTPRPGPPPDPREALRPFHIDPGETTTESVRRGLYRG